MAKIPFSIEHREKIESGEYKVETRDGRTARIICWDRKDNNYPIIALFEEYGKECLLSYTQNGQHVIGKSNVSDLFLVTPEPELSEFEKKLSDVFGYAISMSVSDPKKPTDEFVREYAPELLALARKQLQPEIDAEIEKAYKTADEVQYRKGREEALKDLPRWNKCPLYFEHGEIWKTDKDEDVLSYQGYRILLSDLAKLPKEG